MHLTGYEAEKQRLVKNSTVTRTSSIDLTVDRILFDGKSYKHSFRIDPQGMCVIVSREYVNMRSGYAALAVPKTSLCMRGLLTLNTGFIDPGYKGHISTVAINFNKDPIFLNTGDSFLRLSFHKLDGEKNLEPDITEIDHSYFAKRLRDTELYPDTFLDVARTKNELKDEVIKGVTGILQRRAVILITSLTFLLLVVGWVFNRVQYEWVISLLNRSPNVIESTQSISNREIITELQQSISDLREQLNSALDEQNLQDN